MAASNQPVPGEELLGDYRLGGILSEGARTRTYRARQVSMDRIVVLERLKEGAPGEAEVVDNFLADVRAKAAVDHPGIGSVYEAVTGVHAVYYTREFLGGRTLLDLREAGARLPPPLLAGLLRQVGSAMEYLEQSGLAKLPLEPRHVFLGEHGVARISNLAVAGEEGAAPAGHDRLLLAELGMDLLLEGAPGATRARTLLNLMAEADGTGLSWTQVTHTARKLEQDLSEGAKVASQAIKTGPIARSGPGRRRSRVVLGTLGTLLVVAVLAVGGFLLANRKGPPAARDLSAMVEVAGGDYLTHEGKTVALSRFWIDAHEVTIAEYAAFLAVLDELPEETRTGYDHPEQPAFKRDHVPDDWAATHAAARSGGTLEGRRLDLNHPVARVDWWDAYAYANWKGGRLPSQEEWFAAAQEGGAQPAAWGPVDELAGDLTPGGVHGLAGNVSEWVRDPATNPAFPMNPRKPLCCGASYLDPRNGVRARTWLPNRSARRPDVGFRTVRDSAP